MTRDSVIFQDLGPRDVIWSIIPTVVLAWLWVCCGKTRAAWRQSLPNQSFKLRDRISIGKNDENRITNSHMEVVCMVVSSYALRG